DNACARARKWILDHGGVTHIPSWERPGFRYLVCSSGLEATQCLRILDPSFISSHASSQNVVLTTAA
ncbi:hypothetical protein SLA2020_282520, partial [Shorea laevis]